MKKLSLLVVRSTVRWIAGVSIMLTLVVSAYAKVTVVEAVSTQQAEEARTADAANKATAELVYKLQLLQQEVLEVRGMLEEQQHELSLLKQQRLDDYVNLDRRILEIGQASTVSAIVSENSESPVASLTAKNQKDKEEFDAAYELVKQRQLDKAKLAFEAFLKKYPASEYSPNAYYWTGALYFIDGDFSKAKTYFQAIVAKYKNHSKYPEALYKLAEINYELGERDAAKAQLQELINNHSETSVNTVRKARGFLEKHYL